MEEGFKRAEKSSLLQGEFRVLDKNYVTPYLNSDNTKWGLETVLKHGKTLSCVFHYQWISYENKGMICLCWRLKSTKSDFKCEMYCHPSSQAETANMVWLTSWIWSCYIFPAALHSSQMSHNSQADTTNSTTKHNPCLALCSSYAKFCLLLPPDRHFIPKSATLCSCTCPAILHAVVITLC